MIRCPALTVVACLLLAGPLSSADLRLLFLGDNGHHRPGDRFAQLAPVLFERGITLQYTDDLTDLTPEVLKQFHGLVVYANIDRIDPVQADALLDFVAAGGGFVPLHCASYCFRNDDRIVALTGGQFLRHEGEVFGIELAEPLHPILRGFAGFRSWDETYIHTRHNTENRTVLEFRRQGPQLDGQDREPWTWVRTHGRGRVFYTAWGHDERTWGHPGFQNLVERGIRWACGDDPTTAGPYVERADFQVPEMTTLPTDVAPFAYVNVGARIPNYTPSANWGTQGQPFHLMQSPLQPDEAVTRYVTPVDFELRLFVSESQLGAKPIAMNWDEQGRLWVCETVDYPNELHPQNRGRDRVEIVEDTDGDGAADRVTLFEDQLSIPTAILPIAGGCLVQNGTETLFLKDRDGDGRADLRQVLISNWALGDTHGGVSNFRLGLDNWIYAMQGYNNSTPEIERLPPQTFRMGFFRFRIAPARSRENSQGPADEWQVTELEFLRSTDNNTWGLGISEEGLIFGSTANRNPSVFLSIPNRFYESVRGWSPEQLRTIADTYLFRPITDKVRQVDQHGGYTAGAGHALYTARRYPQTWWNRTAFVCGPTGHLVGTFVLSPQGADFRSTSPCNLVASDDEWAAPIMAEVGPDGNVWILDWYNYIVQHNPTPHGFETGRGNAYETDLRDKRHGRIYRLLCRGLSSAADSADETRPDLRSTDPAALVAALAHPTMLIRLQAQRLLVERGQRDVVPGLQRLVENSSVDAIGLNVGAIHALWTLDGLGAATAPVVTQALRHPSAGVRRNAALVLPPGDSSTAALLPLLDDADSQVRLAAILRLAELPPELGAAQAIAARVSQSSFAGDRWLSDALTSAAARNASGFLSVLAGSDGAAPAAPLDGKALPIAAIVAEHVARGAPSTDDTSRLVLSITTADPRLSAAVLEGLARGWPRQHRVSLSDDADRQLLRLLDRLPPGSKGQLVRLASLWGSRTLEQQAAEIVDALLRTCAEGSAPTDQRLDAARQLIGFRPDSPEIVAALLAQITPQTQPELSTGLLDVLSGSTGAETGPQIVEAATRMTPLARQAAIRTLLGRPQTTRALLSGLEAGQLQLSDLSLDQQRLLGDHPQSEIRGLARRLLSQGGGLPDPDRDRVLQELLPLTQQSGDVPLGQAMFVKHCGKCHQHAALADLPDVELGNIGPNLSGMAVHPRAELLTHIIDPSRSVEGNFRQYTVVTTEGLVLAGMLASETRTTIELIDTTAKRHAIPRTDIEELVGSRKSVMPDGFEKQMTVDELTGLLAFLTQRGRFLPLDLRKVATIVTTRPMFYGRAPMERLIFEDWGPKTFRGVPFVLVDPQGDRQPNAIMLHGPQGQIPPTMPRHVALPVGAPVGTVHLLSGVSGWGFPAQRETTTSLVVRLHYDDGQTEEHELQNGVHFADYIRRTDVPQSEFAFDLDGRQLRYLAVRPSRPKHAVRELQLLKGDDRTAPIVMAVTVEAPQ
jgi:hypothetical protein